MGHVFGTIAPILGGIVGTAIAPGIGTAIGAGLGSTVGNLSEGKNFGQSALGGLETGGLTTLGPYVGPTVGGLISGKSLGQSVLGGLESGVISNVAGEGLGGSGGFLGNELSGTLVGNALSSAGSEVSGLGSSLGTSLDITGPGGLTSEVSGLGSNLGITGQGGLTSEATSGLSAAGKDLGITGPGGLTSDVSNLWGKVAGTSAAGAGGAGIPANANTFAPGFSAGSLPLTPSIPTSGGAGGGILSGLGGGKGGGLFGGSTALGLLSAAPVALDLLRGNQPYKGQTQLQQSAAQLGQQGTQLQSYLQTGTLPPGAQAAINQATAAAQAAIRSQYASMGMSGSSAEAQDLAAAQQAGVTQATNMASQLLSTGIQSTQMSDQLYQDIMNQSMSEDNDLSSAIGNFAVKESQNGQA